MNCVKTTDRSHASRTNALHAAAITSSSPIHQPIPSKKLLHKDPQIFWPSFDDDGDDDDDALDLGFGMKKRLFLVG
jgi:hypothetical protein